MHKEEVLEKIKKEKDEGERKKFLDDKSLGTTFMMVGMMVFMILSLIYEKKTYNYLILLFLFEHGRELSCYLREKKKSTLVSFIFFSIMLVIIMILYIRQEFLGLTL